MSLVEVLAVSTGTGSAGEDWTIDTDSLRMWLAVPLPILLLPETPTGDEECAVESNTTTDDAFPGDETTVPVLVVVTKFLVIVCTSSLTAFRVAMGICGRDGGGDRIN